METVARPSRSIGPWTPLAVVCLIPLGVFTFLALKPPNQAPQSLEELDALAASGRTPIVAAMSALAVGTGALLIAAARNQVPPSLGGLLAAVYLGGWTLAALSRISGVPAPVPRFEVDEWGVREFVQYAVREGLKKDGPDPGFVGSLMTPEHFIHKCFICWGVSLAFDEYATSRRRSGGFPKDVDRDLRSPERKTRLAALEKLTQRYVSHARARLPDEERRKMRAGLDEQKSRSGSLLRDFKNDICPSCSGATKPGP